jgi:hypothetical protein
MFQFDKNKYNYYLNGIEHEIILSDNLKIDRQNINEKILVSNKYMIKYINDLFDYYSIEYCILGDMLLGQYIFNGIHIFSPLLEIGINNNYIHKILKIKDEIINDGNKITFFNGEKNTHFELSEFKEENKKLYIKISSVFFDNIVSSIYIYLFHTNNNIVTYYSSNNTKYNIDKNKIMEFNFNDIFPIRKIQFEEFTVSVPNKIEQILHIFNFNLKDISFQKDNHKKEKKQLIEELSNDTKKFSENENIITKFISVIKPFF